MTQKQARQLARAQAIAARDAINVLVGTSRANGQPVYGVRSRTDGHYYLLHVEGERIRCQCSAHQHGRVCAHAAAVRDHLIASRAAAEAAAKERAEISDWVRGQMYDEDEARMVGCC